MSISGNYSGLFLLSAVADTHDRVAFSSKNPVKSGYSPEKDSHVVSVTIRRVSEECNNEGGICSDGSEGLTSSNSLKKLPLKKRLKSSASISPNYETAALNNVSPESPSPSFICRSNSSYDVVSEDVSIHLSGAQPSLCQYSWKVYRASCKELFKRDLVEMYFSDKKPSNKFSSKKNIKDTTRKRGLGTADCKDENGRDVEMGYFSKESLTLAPLPPNQEECRNTKTAVVSEDAKKLRKSTSLPAFTRRLGSAQTSSRAKQYQNAAFLMSRSPIASTLQASKVSMCSLSPSSPREKIVEPFANEDKSGNGLVEHSYKDMIFPIIPTTLNVLSKRSQKNE